MSTRRQFLHATAATIAAGALSARATASAADDAQPTAPGDRSIVDWHGHWVGPRVVALLGSRPSPRPPQGAGWFDIDARLRHMDTAGVQRQVLSWVGAAFEGALTPDEARPLWRAQNDDVGATVRAHPARFSGLATLPTANVAWAAEELERAHGELGLLGAVLPLDAFMTIEGARALAPIFEVAQKHRSHIFVHRGPAAPGIPGQRAELGDANAYFGLAAPGGPRPTGIAGEVAAARASLITAAHLAAGVITLALSEFLDPYPDVTVQVAMLGGAIALVGEQIALVAEEAGRPSPEARLKRVYLDTGQSGRGPRAIRLAASVFGVDRILFGSDSGPIEAIAPVVASVRQTEITASEQALILSGNARRLLAAKGVTIA